MQGMKKMKKAIISWMRAHPFPEGETIVGPWIGSAVESVTGCRPALQLSPTRIEKRSNDLARWAGKYGANGSPALAEVRAAVVVAETASAIRRAQVLSSLSPSQAELLTAWAGIAPAAVDGRGDSAVCEALSLRHECR